jgi:tRNA threonylcarbamoyladenosine biosynthesis protein TsaB
VRGLILSIESSTFCCSVAISDPDRVFSEVTFNLRSDGGRRLAPAIREVLGGLSMSLSDLSAIAVSRGPGSFTGLRIGIATAKTLARANDLPLYTANSLLLLAFNARMSDIDICPLLDARKNEVYAALYRFRESSFVEKIAPTLVDPLELAKKLTDPVILLGEGSVTYRIQLQDKEKNTRRFAPPPLSLPRASYLACLVHSGMITESVEDIMGLEPLYIRRPEAEVRWKSKTSHTKSQ